MQKRKALLYDVEINHDEDYKKQENESSKPSDNKGEKDNEDLLLNLLSEGRISVEEYKKLSKK